VYERRGGEIIVMIPSSHCDQNMYLITVHIQYILEENLCMGSYDCRVAR
jgi:hypothetical protein